MEIRLLNEHEIQWAVNTAVETFETCVRPFCRTQEEVNRFYGYVNPEHLWREMSGGRLYLFGVFDEGQMCAVSAMQGNGHITILSVKQECQLRRMGTQLLNAMYSYAADMLRLDRVTVLVSPVVKAAYFYKKGFMLLQAAGAQNPGVLLQRLLNQQSGYGQYGAGVQAGSAALRGGWQSGPGMNPGEIQQSGTNIGSGVQQQPMPEAPFPSEIKEPVFYPTRKVSTKLVLIVTAASLGLCFFISAALAIVHIVTNV